jgi:hypothetical protein
MTAEAHHKAHGRLDFEVVLVGVADTAPAASFLPAT